VGDKKPWRWIYDTEGELTDAIQPHRPPTRADQGGIQVEPEKPDQFCNPMEGLDNRTPIFVSPYPAAWKAEVVDEDKHRGFEYIRFVNVVQRIGVAY